MGIFPESDHHLLGGIFNGFITPKLLKTNLLVIYEEKKKESKRAGIKRESKSYNTKAGPTLEII